MNQAAADKTSRRRQRRLRSGRRNLLLCGGAALGLLLLYWLISSISIRAVSFRRSREIEKALALRQTVLAQKLINDFKRHFPQRQNQRKIAIWQQKSAELQKNAAARKLKFHQLLHELESALASSASGTGKQATWESALAETATYAETAAELEQLYSLEKQIRQLARRQELQKARLSVEFLQQIRQKLPELARLRQQKNYTRHQTLYRQCSDRLDKQLENTLALPEAAAEIMQLKQLLQQEMTLSQQAAKADAAEQQALQYLLEGIYPEEITARSQQFLQKYPASAYSPSIRQLLLSLQFVQKDFRSEAARQQQTLTAINTQTRQLLRRELTEIMQKNMQGTVFELTLTSAGKLYRFETYEKCAFSPPDAQGFIRIKFNDPSGRTIRGRFRSDGRGEVTSADGTYRGKLTGSSASGYLPEAYWQQTLYQLSSALDKTNDAAGFIGEFYPQIKQNQNRLPHKIARSLLQALQKADQHAGGARQWQFNWNFWSEAAAGVPVFAGVLWQDQKQTRKFFPARKLKKSSLLWQLEVKDKAVLRPLQPADPAAENSITVIVTAANGVNWANWLKKYQQTARQTNLQMPQKPQWLQAVQ